MFALVAMSLTAILITAVGFQVWRLQPHSRQRQLFFILSFIISGWMMCNYFSKIVTDPGLFLLFVRLVMIITDLLPPTLFLFSYCFPQGKITLSRRKRHLVYVWAVFITLLNFTDAVFTSCHVVGDSFMPDPGWGIIFVLANMIVLLSMACFNFFKKTKNATGLEKVRLTYFAFAFSLAMIFAVVFNLILPAFFQNSDLMNVGIASMGITLIGVTGYSILKTNFSGIDLVIADTIYYSVLLAWLVFPFAAHYYFPQLRTAPMIASSFVLYFLWSICLIYIHNHFEHFLIKRIVNHGADWSVEQEKFFSRIQNELDHEQIIAETNVFFSLLIKNTGHQIIGDFADDDHIQSWGNLPEKTKQLYTLAHQAWMQKNFGPWLTETAANSSRATDRRLAREMSRYGVAAMFPICFYDEFRGVILFGTKLNGNPYFVQDVSMITQTLRELSPLLNKAIIHQNTKDFNEHLQRKINHATAKVRRMNEKLIAADKLKDEFVSVASHELRTPMTAIKGYLWLVAKNNTPKSIETNQKYIEIALKSTERLIALVNDMLTISRIEGGRYTLNLEILDARELLDQIQSELAPIASNKNIKLTIKKSREKLLVNADSKRILEVLHNLTGNALKFTKEGGVTLHTRSDDKYVYIDVTDTGVGIDEADFTKLFSKFARMEKSYVKIKETGTGLGLYISRQIMHLHKGDITFTSQLGKGSTFTIYLPRITEVK